MGFLQDRPLADEGAVWRNVSSMGDYPGGSSIRPTIKNGEACGDYVFGRMLKLQLAWDDESVKVKDGKPRGDYQA